MTQKARVCRGHWYFCVACDKLSKLVLPAIGQVPPRKSVCASCGGETAHKGAVEVTPGEVHE